MTTTKSTGSKAKTSERNIHQRMLAIIGEFVTIKKERTSGGLPYSYVGHDAVTREIRQLFVKHEVLPIPVIVSWEKDSQGSMDIIDIVVEIDFVNVDNPQDRYTVKGVGQGFDKSDKAAGKAYSYACKNAYLKALLIESGDDEPGQEYHEKSPNVSRSSRQGRSRKNGPAPAQAPGNGRIRPEQLRKITSYMIERDSVSAFDSWLAQEFHVSSVNDLTESQATAIIRGIEKNMAEESAAKR